jgi:hypothetical protein
MLTYLLLPVDCQILFTVTENHGVGGSIPPLGTTKINNLAEHLNGPDDGGLTEG